MKTDWSHLPNANHIDRILISLKQNPDMWSAAWDMVQGRFRMAPAWDMARNMAWDMAQDIAWDRAKRAAWRCRACDSTRNTWWVPAVSGARSAILALIAYDRAGSYLTLNPEQVKMLAYLGDNIAILMYPAVVALQHEKEKQNALQ